MKTLIIDPLSHLFSELVTRKSLSEYFYTENIPAQEVEIIIIKTFTCVDEDFLKNYPKLKLIIRAGSGYDNIDLATARKNGVYVCNTPETNVIPAYEHTISLIFLLLKQHQKGKYNLFHHKWKEDLPRNWELQDLKALVVGVGRIGNRVARFLLNQGAQVQGVDPYLTPSEWQECGINKVSYVEGLKWCNLISYHCPLTSETKDYFSHETLNSLLEPAWLINTARGGIINDEALLKGLQEGKILGAGLDVFRKEPNPDLPYRDFANVYLTPHTGAYTINAPRRMTEEILQVWEAFVFHNRLLNEVKEYPPVEHR